MVEFNVGNILKMPQILKIPELGLAFITLMVARLGIKGSPAVGVIDDDGFFFVSLVIYGFFFIVLIQLLAMLFGDRSPFQDFLFALFGFIFYLSAGALIVDKAFGCKACKGTGSMAIITSIVFLVDMVFSGLNLKN